jgi:two-component system LytT family response regulator
MTLRIVIADDEPVARRGIRQLLAPYDDVEVVGEARSGREAVRLIEMLAPDLVFLDVQMPELDGFDVLRQIAPKRLPAVIFVTAYDTFAVRAFEAHALDYIVKPVVESRFRDAMRRCCEHLMSRAALLRFLSSPRLVIADVVVDVDDIAWIEAEDYYAAVHVNDKRHLIRESLSSLESRLDRSSFVRVHRAAIVNLAHVREMRGDSTVVLRDGTRLPLSRRRRQSFEEALRRFAAGGTIATAR